MMNKKDLIELLYKNNDYKAWLMGTSVYAIIKQYIFLANKLKIIYEEGECIMKVEKNKKTECIGFLYNEKSITPSKKDEFVNISTVNQYIHVLISFSIISPKYENDNYLNCNEFIINKEFLKDDDENDDKSIILMLETLVKNASINKYRARYYLFNILFGWYLNDIEDDEIIFVKTSKAEKNYLAKTIKKSINECGCNIFIDYLNIFGDDENEIINNLIAILILN